MKAVSKIINIWNNVVADNATTSLLTRPESNAIKGFLIILIVLGHNKYVMQGGFSNLYLYSFHVYAFYYLPFLYDCRKTRWTSFFRKNLIRLYVPYTLFFLLLLGVSLYIGSPITGSKALLTYLCGSQYMLHSNLGFGSFLWFLPTMLSVLFFRQIYYRVNIVWRNIMLFASLLCLLGFAYMIPIYVVTWWYSPFCLTVGLSMLFPAVCCRAVFQKVDPLIIVLSFFVLVIAMMVFYPVKNEYVMTYLSINRLICPVLIFSLLLSIKSLLVKGVIIIELGVQSLKIYLFHMLIYNGFYIIMDKYNPDIYIGLSIFLVVITTAYFISKIKLLRYVFPNPK